MLLIAALEPLGLSVKVKLLLSTLLRSTCSLKVSVNLSTVPSLLTSPVSADAITGKAASLMVITSLSTEGLIPSDILFAVPAVRVYFNVVVPKAVVFAEARPTVI